MLLLLEMILGKENVNKLGMPGCADAVNNLGVLTRLRLLRLFYRVQEVIDLLVDVQVSLSGSTAVVRPFRVCSQKLTDDGPNFPRATRCYTQGFFKVILIRGTFSNLKTAVWD
jgi:hypothetical protein